MNECKCAALIIGANENRNRLGLFFWFILPFCFWNHSRITHMYRVADIIWWRGRPYLWRINGQVL